MNEAVDLLDFGDLPDTGAGTSAGNYQTLSGDNGPSHVIVSSLGLGANIDDETNAAQNATATGDDTAGTPDDEDGVTILRPLVAGRNALIQFTVNDPGRQRLCQPVRGLQRRWRLRRLAETPIPNFGYASGSQTAAFNVPASAVGLIGMRMRLTDECSQGGQTPTGAATNGEVEDYLFGAIGNYVWDDTDGDGIQDGGESGVSGVVVHLLDGNGDPVLDGNNQPSTKTTNANGGYEFGGLPPGIYYVVFDAPTGKDFTIQGQGTAATDSDAYPPTGQSNAINLGAGEVDDTIDAGLINEPPPPTYDWGDLPDAGAGQGTGDYMTLSADNGPQPRHRQRPGPGGQPRRRGRRPAQRDGRGRRQQQPRRRGRPYLPDPPLRRVATRPGSGHSTHRQRPRRHALRQYVGRPQLRRLLRLQCGRPAGARRPG